MKILFVSQFRIELNRGGVQRVTETLAREFRTRGHGVSYLVLKTGTTEIVDGVTQYFLPVSGNREKVKFIRQFLHDHRIDVIVNQAGIYPQPLQLLTQAKSESMLLISVHHNCIGCLLKNYENIVKNNFRKTRWIKLIDRPLIWKLLKKYNRIKYRRYFSAAIDKSDALLLLSEKFIPELYNSYGIEKSEKVRAIMNPAPFPALTDAKIYKKKKILFVGRLNVQQKRADLILDLWEKLYDKFPEWTFDVVGEGPIKHQLVSEAQKRGLSRIFFHGFQDPRPYLMEARFFCMTSAFEGYGMVLVEAQAYGVVPFAFNSFSSIGDLIEDKVNGIVIPPFDIEKYATRLTDLMNDTMKSEQMAAEGQQSFYRFHPSRIADQWLGLFNDLNRLKKR